MKRIVRADVVRFVEENGATTAEMTERPGEKGVYNVQLRGSVNNECAFDVADELFSLYAAGKGIVIDMNDVAYLSSAFMEQLIRLQIKLEQTDYETMPIQNLPLKIFESLRDQGFITSLDYEMKEGE